MQIFKSWDLRFETDIRFDICLSLVASTTEDCPKPPYLRLNPTLLISLTDGSVSKYNSHGRRQTNYFYTCIISIH